MKLVIYTLPIRTAPSLDTFKKKSYYHLVVRFFCFKLASKLRYMKKFNDLVFEKHLNYPQFNEHAKIFFDNGFGVSVVTGKSAYSNTEKPYELAVIFGSADSWDLHYDNEVANGEVIGWLDKEEVSKAMIKVQNL